MHNLRRRIVLFSKIIKIWFPFIVIFIVLWQINVVARSDIKESYGRTDATGMSIYQATEFTYLYYYQNLYPIRTSIGALKYNSESAAKLIEEHPETLYNNFLNFITWGDHGRSVLLIAASFLAQTSKSVSLIPMNTLIFITSLVLIYASFEYCNLRILGIFTVLFFGSQPFQIYEVYKNNNIFGMGISLMLILLSFHLPLIYNKYRSKFIPFVIAVISGIILGFTTHVRMEYVEISVACLMVYLTIPKTKLYIKVIISAVFISTIILTSFLINNYFNYKINQSIQLLTKVAPQNITKSYASQNYHTLWHPIWIGFSDFDEKYFTSWSDNKAYDIAMPYLLSKNKEKFEYLQKNDRDAVSVQPEYKEFMRQRVLTMIITDPLWYTTILIQRFYRIVFKVVPIYINIGSTNIEAPFHPILSFFVMGYLIYKKNFQLLKIILFVFSVSISVLLIYSDKGINNITSYHYMACIVAIHLVRNYFCSNSIKQDAILLRKILLR